MAVEPQKAKSRKKQQIEPLDWSTMSQSPALKGMVSFLEVTPEDIRRQQGQNGDSRTGSDACIGSESLTGNDPNRSDQKFPVSTGQLDDESDSRTGSFAIVARRVEAVEPGHAISDSRTGSDTRIARGRLSAQRVPRSELHTVTEESTGSDSLTGSESHIVNAPKEQKRPPRSSNADATEVEEAPVSDSRIGDQPMSESRTGQQKQTYFVGADQYSRPQRRMAMLQGEVIWQNRRIRKCVLAQDAHSQGEDALFSAMWNAAKPYAADPAGSRTLRIGYAELAQKSRMHRSNIRINIAGLRAKLAIEVLDEHDSRDVMPRLYRLYSYKEILDRRRAAGLEYVIRKKSVVFVTETGELVALPGLPKIGVRKTQKQSIPSRAQNSYDLPTHEERAEQLDLDVRQISEALSKHWPVDEAAAQQLLRQCRSVRRDAEIGEIVFFINEKLQIALTNKNIKNPTGLILATVPQCFEGDTFQDFRRRRNEALTLEAEEQNRRRQQERDLEAWLDGKMQELRVVAADDSQPEAAREKARRELKHYGA